MQLILQNEWITASIAAKGAELQSLKKKATGMEYMWSANPTYWGKYSPVLFPIVGSLKNDTYYYEDQSYQLPRHGFARDMFFEMEQVNESEAVCTLRQNATTLAVYPFEFIFQLYYKLQGNALICTYKVYNPGAGDLLFSVGGHPAFAVPLTADTNFEDYYLQFDTTDTLLRHKLKNGLIGTETEIVPTANGRLALLASLFYEDAIVLKQVTSTHITLASDKHPHGLDFNYTDFPFFGIWAAKDAPFICLEPWCGIADGIHHNQQLVDKEGIITLAPHASWQRNWSVACF